MRVLGISFIVLALPLLVYTFIFFQLSYENALRDKQRDLKEVADYRILSITELEPVKQVLLQELEVLLELPKLISKMPSEKANEELKKIRDLGNPFSLFVLGLKKEGSYPIIASSEAKQVGTDFESFDQLPRILEEGEGEFLRFEQDSETNTFVPTILVARVIQNDDGEPLGIFVISSNVQARLGPLLVSGGEKKDVHFALLSPDGIVFEATDKNLQAQYFWPITATRRAEIVQTRQLGSYHLPSAPLPIKEGELTRKGFFDFEFDGVKQIAYVAPISEIDIYLVAYSPKMNIYGTAMRRFIALYVIYGLIFLIGGITTIWLSIWISRPLRQLSAVMGKVASGDLDVRFIEQPLGFEINRLGNSFNQMLDRLFLQMQRAEDERVAKETFARELAIGREAQGNLLPKEIQAFQNLDFAHLYLPAKEVGADFYDLYSRKNRLGEEEVVLAIADASGKGVSACLYALGVRSMLRTYSTLHDDVGRIMGETNNLFNQDTGETGMFVTALMGVYNPQTGRLRYTSFGHVPGIVRRKNGQILRLAHSGMAMGLINIDRVPTDEIRLEEGDLLLFYTDGFTEAYDEHHRSFTEAKLMQTLQRRSWKSAEEVVEGLKEELLTFIGAMPQEDDITLLAMRVDS